VYFKASESRFGALAKARFGGRFFARESPDFHAAIAGEAAGSGRKWQCDEERLEKSWHILDRARAIKPDIVARIHPSGAAGDLAGIDVEDLACCADVGEGQGIGAGHPHLRAELCQFIEQCRAPGGIEMGHHLVEQQ
jgi:hypothetical protein